MKNTTTNNKKFYIKNCSYEFIKPFWQLLWPKRTDIKPMSSLKIDLSYDLDIYKKYKPIFWALMNNNTCCGVVSGHQTSEENFRTRGLYIDARYRGRGLSRKLLEQPIEEARALKLNKLWSLPRKNSFYAYNKVGFDKASDWIEEGFFKGLNCIAVLHL